jgi:uncharacterized protein (UPF0332 family)
LLDLTDNWLQKATENLQAASSELASQRYNSCANRAYYAAFQAALWALSHEGTRPPRQDRYWGHDFVQAQFSGALINRRKVYPSSLRSALTDLYKLRVQADYETTLVDEIRAYRAVRKAREFVNAVLERSKSP